jgi:hypothetical protein
MAEYTIDLPPGYGVPTIDLATDLLPQPTMEAIADSEQIVTKYVTATIEDGLTTLYLNGEEL